LDKKREKFARFYFLANDELLEILSKASNPPLIVDHLKNMFENIYNLMLEGDKQEDVIKIISAEGEKVKILNKFKARGDVEGWLGSLQDAMIATLRNKMREANSDYKI